MIGLDDVEQLLGRRPFESRELRNIDRFRHGADAAAIKAGLLPGDGAAAGEQEGGDGPGAGEQEEDGQGGKGDGGSGGDEGREGKEGAKGGKRKSKGRLVVAT